MSAGVRTSCHSTRSHVHAAFGEARQDVLAIAVDEALRRTSRLRVRGHGAGCSPGRTTPRGRRRAASRRRRGRRRRWPGRPAVAVGVRRWRRTRRRSCRGKSTLWCCEPRGPALDREEQHEARQRAWLAPELALSSRAAAGWSSSVAYSMLGVGVRHDDVGVESLAVVEHDSGDRVRRSSRRVTADPKRKLNPAVDATLGRPRRPDCRCPPPTCHAPKVCSTNGITASAAGARRGSEPVYVA